MTFDESRDNLLDIEAASIEADAHAETCEADATRCMERRVADAWWAGFNHAKAEAVPDDVDHDADDWSPEVQTGASSRHGMGFHDLLVPDVRLDPSGHPRRITRTLSTLSR